MYVYMCDVLLKEDTCMKIYCIAESASAALSSTGLYIFFHYMHTYLEHNQTMYMAGGFDDAIRDTCWYVQNNTKPQPEPKYTSKTDTHIWVHVSIRAPLSLAVI